MALSNSYDFTVTRNDLIRDALLEIGAIDAGEDPPSTIILDVSRQLNMMVKSWNTKYNLWRFTDLTVTLDGSQSYTIGPAGDVVAQRPLKITHGRRVESAGYEVPITVFSLQEYKDQPMKSATGTVVAVAYDPQLTAGVLFVWPAATSGSLIVTALMPLMDLDTASDNPQFPGEWALCLATNLAVRIHPQFPGTVLQPETVQTALMTLEDLQNFDSESTSMFISPEFE